ncbi:protein PET117 homolog, mitochondrial [Belonocnema kinseyi]|uniref:protein PET117 homolog, mitochondrial n=1 Tax=Belonocnema kinseyi TaxID=2817044 RepID=UPI00143D0005|nr:protein PET117 homolog, mitochondrial [Belonocnema kinseyi]
MSLVSKATFALSCISTVSIVFYVHYRQQLDKEQIHLGVIRDQERQELRKKENLYLLQQQIALGDELRKEQLKNS